VKYSSFVLIGVALLFASQATAQECIECHQQVTPGIVTDWQLSKHSQNDIDCSVCHGDQHISMLHDRCRECPNPDA